jgi:hypothetical protein
MNAHQHEKIGTRTPLRVKLLDLDFTKPSEIIHPPRYHRIKRQGSKMDFEKAKLNPVTVFKSPQEVVSNQDCRATKIEISAMGTGREVDGSGGKHARPTNTPADRDLCMP